MLAKSEMNNDARGVHPEVLNMNKAQFENEVMNLAAQDKQFIKIIGNYDEFYKTLQDMAKASKLKELEETHKLFQEDINQQLKDVNISAKRKQELEKAAAEEQLRYKEKAQEEIQRVQQKALNVTLIKQENAYKYASVKEKARMAQDMADRAQAWLKEKEEEAAIVLATETDNKKVQLAAIEEVANARKIASQITSSQQFKELNALEDKLKNFKQDAAQGKFDVIKSMLKLSSADLNDLATQSEKRAEASKKELDAMRSDYDKMVDAGASEEQLAEQMKDIMNKQAEVLKNEFSALATNLASDFRNAVNKEFETVESLLNDSKAQIEGRLQGSDKTYDSVMNKISTNISMSPFVKTQDVIRKMQEAADKGLAYNIEQRAFLATISDKIASTFDAFDSNLTRLIRLQQADTTAARLGMEASLTKFFNGMFQDSSYLAEVSDSISAAIIDANASMTRDMSAAFEYTVQKWLGSLSSLGMDSGTLQNIAQGINYIATGDVNSLSSNTSLQTLFAMSASNAGLSYSDLLLNGLDADTTNKLLESMVKYLKDIAENSDNQVVRSAYGDIFNLSLADMKAVSNLTTSDIKNIASNSLSYSGMTKELTNQFAQQITRTTLGGMMNTLYENAVFGVAEDLVSNPATYAMYKMLNFMEDRNLDIAIPFVNAAGFGLDPNTSVQDILNLGLGLSGAMSLVGNILGGLGSAGGMNLDAWGATEYTQRGNGLAFSTGDVGQSTSGSTYVASGSSQDMKKSAISTATDDAEETSKITNKNIQPGYTMDDFYKAVVEGSEPNIRTEDALLKRVYHTKDSFLHTRDTRMLYTKDQYLRVYDMALESGLTTLDEYLYKIEENTKSISLSNTDILSHFIAAGNILAGLALDASGERLTIRNSSDVLSSSTMRVTNNTTDTKGLDVFVTNVQDLKPVTQKVELVSNTTVDINKATLVKAFQEALGFDTSTRNFKTFAKIWNDIYEGNASISIKTKTGESVATDLTDASMDKLRLAIL